MKCNVPETHSKPCFNLTVYVLNCNCSGYDMNKFFLMHTSLLYSTVSAIFNFVKSSSYTKCPI